MKIFKFFQTICSNNNNRRFILCPKYSIQDATAARICSTKPTFDANSDTAIGVVDDGRTILCWHPKAAHPYEHSKPIPHIESEVRDCDSELKVQIREEVDRLEKHPKYPTNLHLQKLTFTTKHRWFIQPVKKYLNPPPVPDRDGI